VGCIRGSGRLIGLRVVVVLLGRGFGFGFVFARQFADVMTLAREEED